MNSAIPESAVVSCATEYHNMVRHVIMNFGGAEGCLLYSICINDYSLDAHESPVSQLPEVCVLLGSSHDTAPDTRTGLYLIYHLRLCVAF